MTTTTCDKCGKKINSDCWLRLIGKDKGIKADLCEEHALELKKIIEKYLLELK